MSELRLLSAFIVYSTIAFSTAASFGAPTKLLDCNTSGGPDQQVTVIEQGDQLTLIELTASGASERRALPRSEWNGRIIRLQDGEYGQQSTLSMTAKGWVFETRGPGVHEFGYADCWVSCALALSK